MPSFTLFVPLMMTTLPLLLVRLIQKKILIRLTWNLAIADLDAVNRRINKVKKVAQQGDKEAKAEMAVLE